MASKPLPKPDCRRCLLWRSQSNFCDIFVVMSHVRWHYRDPNNMEVTRHDNKNPPFTRKSGISSGQGCICRLCLGKYKRLDPKALQQGGLLFGGFNMKDE